MQWGQLKDALKLVDEEQRNRALDPFFIATFLGICATGLVRSVDSNLLPSWLTSFFLQAMMPAKRARRDGFGAGKSKMVDLWLEGAMIALNCGRVWELVVRNVEHLLTLFVSPQFLEYVLDPLHIRRRN
jgi:hypothetical protein